MTTLAMGYRDELMPRKPPGMGKGLALALLVHVGLVIALTFSVNWRSREPEGIEAELWAAVPQIAAPRAVEPEPVRPTPPKPEPKVETPPPKPAPPDPQIAIEKEKQKKELLKKQEEKEKTEKLEKAKADKLEADRKKKEADRQAAQLEAQRNKQLERILAQAGATGDSPGKAAKTAGPSAGYAGRVVGYLRPKITFPSDVDSSTWAEVEVTTGPTGAIIQRRILKSSGVEVWNDAVLRALDKAGVLPPDTDGKVPSPMVIRFNRGDL